MGACNLLDQLVYYGSYHNNKWNQLIHVVFVPVIFLTAAVWLSYTPTLLSLSLPLPLGAGGAPLVVNVNGAALFFAVYAAFYVLLDPLAGLSWAALMLPGLRFAMQYAKSNPSNAWLHALFLHVLSWYMQIHPGHMVFEKRAPALTDSFFQSLMLAPLFVWFEVLFLLGYRPALRARLQERVDANIRKYRAAVAGKVQ